MVEFVQPAALVPKMVYVVELKGVDVNTVPLNPIGNQVYVLAPPTVTVTLDPKHNTLGLALAVTVGMGFTINEIVFELLQIPVVPVTV